MFSRLKSKAVILRVRKCGTDVLSTTLDFSQLPRRIYPRFDPQLLHTGLALALDLATPIWTPGIPSDGRVPELPLSGAHPESRRAHDAEDQVAEVLYATVSYVT